MTKKVLNIKAKTIICGILFLVFSSWSYVYGDITVEYTAECKEKSTYIITGKKTKTLDYNKRLFIKDNFLALQIYMWNEPMREYGFDFNEGVYYEADLVDDKYYKYDFKKLKKDFATKEYEILNRTSEGNKFALFEEALSSKSGWGNPKYYKVPFLRLRKNDYLCERFNIAVGKGYSAWRPLSWGKKISLWASSEVPNYEEYLNIVNQMRKHSYFYKLKANEVSDFIMFTLIIDQLPISYSTKLKTDAGFGTLTNNSKVQLKSISTKKIGDEETPRMTMA